MRPVLHSDLDHCVRVLLALPENEWAEVMPVVLERAHLADSYRKRQGRSHGRWGDGSLCGATQTFAKAPLPASCDAQYCAAILVAVTALTKWRHLQQSRQRI